MEGIDGNQIHLRADARIHGTDATQAEKRGKQIEIRVMEGKQAKIEVIDNGPPQNRPSVDLVLQVPKRVSIIGETNAGEADVSGVANADIDANAGRVQVSNIPGTATIRTNAGSVEVREVGDVWVKTDMGRVTADDVKGKLNISTNAGEVDVKTRYPVAADWQLKTRFRENLIGFPKRKFRQCSRCDEDGIDRRSFRKSKRTECRIQIWRRSTPNRCENGCRDDLHRCGLETDATRKASRVKEELQI